MYMYVCMLQYTIYNILCIIHVHDTLCVNPSLTSRLLGVVGVHMVLRPVPCILSLT